MNILYVLNSGKPGGMEKNVYDLAAGMVGVGHKVFIWCREGEMADAYKSLGAEVFIRNINLDLDPFYIFALINFLKAYKIQVIHAHELKAVANGLIAASIAGVPTKISHVHTPISEWQEESPIKKLIAPFRVVGYTYLVNKLATKEIALTDSRKNVKIKEGIIPAKIKVIPNGIDLSKYTELLDNSDIFSQEIRNRYGIPEDAFLLGNISRMTQEKGHNLLVNAFAKLVKENAIQENMYLLLAGGGALENELRVLTKNLGIDDRVVITGVFDERDHIKFYGTFDLFVFPTLAEGFGYVLIEAMSSEHPVLCSDLAVLEEVAGDTVKYFKTGNAEDLYSKIIETYQLIKSGGYTLVEDAYNRVKQEYSMDTFIERYSKLYEGKD